jgi:hypothetical protein
VADNDSDTPQIGYIGPRYQAGGVVAVGYNPGNGSLAIRNQGDQMLMPALECFRERCDEITYLRAIEVAQVVSQGWSIWRKHVHPWLEAVRLDADQIAYLNVNPFRTKSQSKFVSEVWDICWQLHLAPLLKVLEPKIVVGLGNDVGRYLSGRISTGTTIITWNRSQAPTATAVRDREAAIDELRRAFCHQAPQTRVAPTMRFRDPRLAELESRWRDLGIGPQFHHVHHFASHKFSGKHVHLDRFIAWCNGRGIRDENAQTLERALDVACRVNDGQDFKEALEQAWASHPIVTR